MKQIAVSVALAALAFLCAAPSAATYCSTHQLGAQGQHARARLVVVDGTGALCDFLDIGSALTYVSGKTRGAASQWTIALRSGFNNTTYNYTEVTATVPTWTTIVGPSAANRPILKLTGLTGTLVSMGTGSALENIVLTAGGTAASTGAVKVVATTGTSATLTDVSIAVASTFGDAQNVDLVSNDAGSLTLSRVDLSKAGASTLSRLVVNGASGIATNVLGGIWSSGTSQAKATENLNASGTISLLGVTIIVSSTVDLAGTTGPITTRGMIYGAVSGNVTPANIKATDVTAGGKMYVTAQTPASATAACTAGQFAFDSGFVYFCPSTNTWVRAALATWP
jgi:hypothetical protein